MIEPLAALTTYFQIHLKEHFNRFGLPFTVAHVAQKVWGQIDIHTMSQVMTIVSISIISFSSPALAPICVPLLCTALVVSILKRQQEAAAFQKSESNKVQQMTNSCLQITAQIEQIMFADHQVAQDAHEVDQKLDDKLLKLTTKLQSLASLCTRVMQNKNITEQLKVVSQVEPEMAKLIAVCQGLQETIAGVAQRIFQTQEQIQQLLAQREKASRDLYENEEKELAELSVRDKPTLFATPSQESKGKLNSQ